MREQHICPWCNSKCEEYNNPKTTYANFICKNCGESMVETFTPQKTVLDIITNDERKLLQIYFSRLPKEHKDRKVPITASNYHAFITKAKRLITGENK